MHGIAKSSCRFFLLSVFVSSYQYKFNCIVISHIQLAYRIQSNQSNKANVSRLMVHNFEHFSS